MGKLKGVPWFFGDVVIWQFQATRGYHFFGEPLIARGGLYNLCWCGPPAEGSLQGCLKNLGLENGVDVGNSSNGYPISFQDRSCSAQRSTETHIFGPFPEASFECLARITVNLMGLCHLLVLPNGRRHLRMLFSLSKTEIDRQTFV